MGVNVDWDVIEGIDDIVKVFKKAISRAEPEEEAAIRQQEAETKAEFWQRQAQSQALQVAKRDALDKYPLAKRFEAQIKGSTIAEIEASAKMFHEQIEAVTKEVAEARQEAQQSQQAIQQQVQQAYGSPAAGGGGSQARPGEADLSLAQQATQRVRDRLQRGEGLQRSGDKMDVNLMAAQRLREAVEFQREAHPELGLGIGGSFKQEPQGNPVGTRVVDARSEARKAASRK